VLVGEAKVEYYYILLVLQYMAVVLIVYWSMAKGVAEYTEPTVELMNHVPVLV